MTKPVLYLHIGLHKTATTALQCFFSKNYRVLLDLGVLYPKTGREEIQQHHYLASSLLQYEHIKFHSSQSPYEYAELLLQEIERYSPESVLISSEIFMENWKGIPSALVPIEKLFSDIKLVLFLRRPDQYAVSANNTHIWYGRKREHSLAYPPIMSILNSVPKERWLIRVFEKQQFKNGNIFHEFLSLLGIERVTGFSYSDEIINRSFSSDTVELCRLINNSEFSFAEVERVKRSILEKSQARFGDTRSFFSPNKLQDLIDNFSVDSRVIAREYLGRKDEVLFYESIEGLDYQIEEYSQVDIKNIINIFCSLYFEQEAKNDRLEKQLNTVSIRSLIRGNIERCIGAAFTKLKKCFVR